MNLILEKNTVFVTAFMTNINKNSKRSIEDYIEYGNKLLNLNISQIIFIEKHIFEKFFSDYDSIKKYFFDYLINDDLRTFEYIIYKNKIFVNFEKNNNYLYNYINHITNFTINTDNPLKDTVEYMFTQCHKTEWVKMAISLLNQINDNNVDDKKEFIWIDYAIYHMIKNENNINKIIENIGNRNIDKLKKYIRVASCWNPYRTYNIDIYKTITWYCAGSIFGGPKNKLIDFADKMREKCIKIILNKNTIMWEVNIWYLFFLENNTLFDYYYCDHNDSIILNY